MCLLSISLSSRPPHLHSRTQVPNPTLIAYTAFQWFSVAPKGSDGAPWIVRLVVAFIFFTFWKRSGERRAGVVQVRRAEGGDELQRHQLRRSLGKFLDSIS